MLDLEETATALQVQDGPGPAHGVAERRAGTTR
jgi:hypothetical protein